MSSPAPLCNGLFPFAMLKAFDVFPADLMRMGIGCRSPEANDVSLVDLMLDKSFI
jgi:hypothetical protein